MVLISEELVVDKRTLAREDKSCRMSSKDPHLMRLGQYLAWVERDAGWTSDDMEYLEDQFQEEPWMNWVQVVLADGSQCANMPFVLLTNSGTNGQQSQVQCPISNSAASSDQEKACT